MATICKCTPCHPVLVGHIIKDQQEIDEWCNDLLDDGRGCAATAVLDLKPGDLITGTHDCPYEE